MFSLSSPVYKTDAEGRRRDRRSNLPAGVKTTSWDARVEKRKKEEAIKLLERTLKEERVAEEERFVLQYEYSSGAGSLIALCRVYGDLARAERSRSSRSAGSGSRRRRGLPRWRSG